MKNKLIDKSLMEKIVIFYENLKIIKNVIYTYKVPKILLIANNKTFIIF